MLPVKKTHICWTQALMFCSVVAVPITMFDQRHGLCADETSVYNLRQKNKPFLLWPIFSKTSVFINEINLWSVKTLPIHEELSFTWRICQRNHDGSRSENYTLLNCVDHNSQSASERFKSIALIPALGDWCSIPNNTRAFQREQIGRVLWVGGTVYSLPC